MKAQEEQRRKCEFTARREPRVEQTHDMVAQRMVGSELTTDHTCGRHETVEECGEQPPEPRRKCATREKVAGGEREKWETGSKESNASNTLHIVFHLPQQQQQQVRPPQQQQQQHPMLFNEACHRNVDLERPMHYNEANDGRYVPARDSPGLQARNHSVRAGPFGQSFTSYNSVIDVVKKETEGCDCLQSSNCATFPVVELAPV